MILKTRGIIFRTVKYGETSVIADIFTEERGLHTFIGGGVRTAKARMPYNLFQPMTVVDIVTYFRDEENALNRLKEMRAGEVFTAIPFDVRRGAVALFMAEICRKSIHTGEDHRDLFEFLVDNLRWLDTTPHPIANLHLHFLVNLAGYLGFQPHPEDDMAGPGALYFDLREGAFTTSAPQHRLFLEPAEAEQLLAFLDVPLERSHEVPLTRPQRKALLGNLLRFYQLHLPKFDEINTPDILEMVME